MGDVVGSTNVTEMVPDRPSELGLHIPGDSWRKQQPFAIAHALDSFLNKGKRFWFFNGATGSGKSIVAAAIGRILEGPTTFLTHTIQLQQQYLDTMEDAVTATGKRNHACREPVWGMELTADDCDRCEHTADDQDCCAYYAQFHDAARAPERVLNYAYGCRVNQGRHIKMLCTNGIPNERGISQSCGGCNPFNNGNLLVCDEGHLAENAVVDAVKIEMVEKSFRAESFPFPNSRLLADWILWAQDNVDRAVEHERQVMAAFYASPNPEMQKKMRRCRAIATALDGMATVDIEDANAVLSRELDRATQRPIWGWDHAGFALFGRFPYIVVMSATLGDPEVLGRKLGLPPAEVAYLDLPSPFPREHRLVFRWPVAALGRKADAAAWRIAFDATDAIIERFPDKKGIVHTSSHKLTEQVVATSKHRDRLIHHTTSGRLEALERFKKEQSPSVLVTASFSTGLDLPGVIGFQVIPKVPFLGLGDEVTRLRFEWGDESDKFGKKNYAAETMNTVVQASGRGVRTEEDKCPTFILDRNFNHLARQAYMPTSFRESLTWLEGR